MGSRSTQPQAGKGARLAYKPIGLISGMVAGAVAGLIFKQVWKRVADEEDAPGPLQSEYSWKEVVLAAVVQGAIFAGVRALVQRGGADGFKRLTGSWPGS